jgi:parallel beta-helix repeat protein
MKSIAFFAVLLIAGLSFSLTTISDCAVLNTAGETYVLNQSASGAPYPYYSGSYTTCIQINASSITLDCGGNSITTTGNAAVEIEGLGTNVIVQNCVLNGGTGVEYMGLNSGRIIYNRINPDYAGISGVLAFSGASGNDILYNNITGGTYGIWQPGDSSLIGNNRLINQDSIGIDDSGTGNMITNNYVSGSSGYGIMAAGHDMYVSSNTVTNCAQVGIFSGAWTSTISNNYVSGSGINGIQLGDGYYATYSTNVTGNHVYSNTGDGIHNEGGTGNRISSNEVYLNSRGIVVLNGYYSEGGWEYTINDVVSNNNVYSNTGDGIYMVNLSRNNFTSNTATSNGGSGMAVENSSRILIDPSYFCSNTGDGLTISDSTNLTVSDSVFCSNTGDGINAGNVNASIFYNNDAYDNGGDGMEFSQSTNDTFTDNLAYENGQSGFSATSGSYSRFTNNIARNNLGDGFALAYSDYVNMTGNSAHDNGVWGYYLVATNYVVMSSNSAYLNDASGFVLFNDGRSNNLTDNSAFENGMNGFEVYSSSNNILTRNTAYQNNWSGIIVYEYKSTVPTQNNTLVNNSLYINDFGVTLGAGSQNTVSQGDNPYNNLIAEMRIIDTLNATILNGDYSGNAYDVAVEGQSGGSFRMTYAMFGEPGGSVVNMTNLSIVDTFGSSDNYTINWTSRSDSPTHNWHIFGNRFVNITDRSGTSSIDRVEWDWTAAEASGYNESNLGLWKYNSSGWTLMNASPNTASHHLSLSAMAPNSDYAIYEFIENCPIINVSGTTFVQSRNYTGSMNPVYLPIAGSPQYACVVINASNVVYDCNGHSITGNLTSGATAGIYSGAGAMYSPRISNITIRNCPMVKAYSTGMFIYNTSDSLITNTTVKNNSLTSSIGYMLYYSPNVNLTNTLAENHTYNYYINLNSNNVRITNSTARTSSTWGYYFSSSVANGSITDSVAINNNGSGIVMDGSGYPVVARNNVSNSASYNADAGIIISANNALVEDNIASGATSTPLVTWGYGFIIEGNNVTFRRNLAYGNKVGIEAFGSGCNVTNNTARNNLQDGFDIYSEDDVYSANDAYQNGAHGFALNYTYTATLISNRAFNNAGNGFSMDEGSEENSLSGNTAYLNAHGFFMNDCTLNNLSGNTAYSNTGHGIYLNASTYNRLIGNNVYSNDYGLSMWSSSNYNVVENNTATTNTQAGLYIVTSAYNNLTNNTASSNSNGVYALSSLYNTMRGNTASGNSGSGFHFGTFAGNSQFVNNTASGNTMRGIYLASSSNSNLNGNTAFNNGQVGVYLLDSSNVSLSSDHLYGNGQDFKVNGTGVSINLSGVVFDNPAGDYTNYTNISINDTVASSYSIDWANNATSLPLPATYSSFAQKFVNITPLSGAVSIDRIVWHWLESELGSYQESNFYLFKNNGTWTLTGATLDTGANTLSLNDLNTFSIFAILQGTVTNGDEVPVTGGEGYDVRIIPACQGFIVEVKDGGSPVNDAFVTGTDTTNSQEFAPRYTNASGQAYISGCDIDVFVKAVKSGRSGTDSGTADCGICPECATDDDCADSEQCTGFLCVPIDCPDGRVVNHACERFECTKDADCQAGQVCEDHHCIVPYECRSDADCAATKYCDIQVGAAGGDCLNVTVSPCGEVIDHKFVAYGYACGTEPGCPSCSQGFACMNHTCIQNDVTCPSTGIVGDRKTCEAKENNLPCVNCDYIVTDPAGKNMTGKTDENGNFILPLNLKGTYKVTLLNNGQPVRIVEVKALPVSQPGGENPPTAAGLDAATSVLFLVILLALGFAVFLYWRRMKGEKTTPPAKPAKK